MSNWPFRFVHAADFHLELPPFGVAEVPDHLRELFVESSYRAAEKVFETVLREEAEFLVLSGDILDPHRSGPRGMLFLAEQFGRLAERDIAVFWAGGRVDPPDAWPTAIRLPDNVHVFPTGRPDEVVCERDGSPLVRVIGVSRGTRRGIRASDFDPDPGGLFTIASVHGSAEAESLSRRGIDYWALGGSHARHTLFNSPHLAHYPGSPQGRQPEESGPHGCTLVQVDSGRNARTTLVPTDVMRWQHEQVVVDESTTGDNLQTLLHERIRNLAETIPEMDLMISWTITGSGPLLGELRGATLAKELLESLRSEHGFGPPAAWSVAMTTESTAVLLPEWYEQQTIRGDFLRQLRHYQMNPEQSLELESYLTEQHLAGALGSAAEIPDRTTRERVLREVATLGVDLLSGEEPES